MNDFIKRIVIFAVVFVLPVLSGCELLDKYKELASSTMAHYEEDSVKEVIINTPDYNGYESVVEVNKCIPSFSEKELVAKCKTVYSQLDKLGRCGTAFAVVGKESLATKEREDISKLIPTGWHNIKYENVNGQSLYNRCHLIAYKLTGEKTQLVNLITATRYMNENMLRYEEYIADYIKTTENHVAYRVTPVFEGDNLVVSGVQMEAYSIEDNGNGIKFNFYCFNIQPDVIINYKTGESCLSDDADKILSFQVKPDFILDFDRKEYHYPTCKLLDEVDEIAKRQFNGSVNKVEELGYTPCKKCKPKDKT